MTGKAKSSTPRPDVGDLVEIDGRHGLVLDVEDVQVTHPDDSKHTVQRRRIAWLDNVSEVEGDLPAPEVSPAGVG